MVTQEWLRACSLHLVQKYHFTDVEATELAETILDSVDSVLDYDPVESADEEMSYWGE